MTELPIQFYYTKVEKLSKCHTFLCATHTQRKIKTHRTSRRLNDESMFFWGWTVPLMHAQKVHKTLFRLLSSVFPFFSDLHSTAYPCYLTRHLSPSWANFLLPKQRDNIKGWIKDKEELLGSSNGHLKAKQWAKNVYVHKSESPWKHGGFLHL